MGYEDRYDPDTDFDRWYTIGTGAVIARSIAPGDRVLELGCATGLMTMALVERGASVVGVDRVEAWLGRARARALPGTTFAVADLATLDMGSRFDHVVAANVVHEMPDPADLLRRCAAHLRSGGQLHVSVPNPRSIHRMLGVAMGALERLDQVSERAAGLETLRMHDVGDLVAAAVAAGFEVDAMEPIMFKPLPNAHMATLPEAVIEGFLAMADEFPEHGAMSYVRFRRP
ncbi:MAG: hypothetical protein QOE63_2065 [Acidimicrobiaceae bacterium]